MIDNSYKISVKRMLIAFFVSLSLLIGLNVVASVHPTYWTSILAMLIFLFFVIQAAKYTPLGFVISLNYLYSGFTIILSGIFIDMNAVLPEVGRIGVPTGAFVRFTIVYLFSSAFLLLLLEKWARPAWRTEAAQKIKANSFWVVPILVIIVMTNLYMVFFGLLHGFPLLENVDKYDYRSLYRDSYLFQLYFPNRVLMAIFLGLICILPNSLTKKISAVCMFVIVVVSFLFSEKFISVFNVLVFFLMPILLKGSSKYQWGNLRALAVKFLPLVAFVVIGLVVVLSVYGYSTAGQYSAVTQVETRMASQGQLWYVADADADRLFRFDAASVRQDIATLKVSADPVLVRAATQPPYSGMYNLMAQYMPRLLFQGYSSRNISLMAGFEAYLLKTFGWLGMFPPMFFLIFLYAVLLSYLSLGMAQQDLIKVVLAGKMLILFQSGLWLGDASWMLGVGVLKFAVLAFVYELILKARNLKFKRTNALGFGK